MLDSLFCPPFGASFRASSPFIRGLLGAALVFWGGACTENNLETVPPDIQVDPGVIAFGTVTMGVHLEAPLNIRNVGSGTLKVDSVVMKHLDRPAFAVSPYAGDLYSEDTTSVVVTFDPSELGPQENVVVITSDDPDEPVVEVPISAADVVPEPVPGIEVDPASLSWGALAPGAQEPRVVTIRSVGTGPLTLSDVHLSTGTSLDFSLTADPSPNVLEPGEEVTATVVYAPTDDVDDSGSLLIDNDDPDSPQVEVPLDGSRDTLPDIHVDPTTLDFGSMALDATATLYADISNLGSADLNLGGLTLTGSSGFSLANDPSGSVLVPGDVTQLGVTLLVNATGAHTGVITIPSDDPDENPVYINLVGLYDAVPEIEVDPLVVDFGNLPEGTVISEGVQVRNVGGDDLTVSDLSLSGSADFSFSASGIPGILPPGGAVTVTVTYHVSDLVADAGLLTLLSDDGDEPVVDVALFGAAELHPDIEVDPPSLSFGTVPLGTSATLSATIRNVGDADLDLISLVRSGSMFDLSLNPEGELLIPGDSTQMQVTYTPSTEASHSGSITITSNDPDESPLVVPLNGAGEELNDPPIADAGDDLSEYPLDTVTLDGSGSYDPNGDYPLTYAWSLVIRPSGSTTALTSASSVSPSLYLDLAGTYVVGLVVTDSTGASSSMDQMTITVAPWQDFHVQLVWDADNIDLDLHVLKTGSSLYDSPNDCDYCNVNPNWGGAGTDDDPSLDIDNIKGYGPENINIIAPASGDYTLAVVYYGEWYSGTTHSVCSGACASTNATIRLYLNGILVYSDTRTMNDDKQVWTVGDVDWPTGIVTPIDSIGSTSRTGCY